MKKNLLKTAAYLLLALCMLLTACSSGTTDTPAATTDSTSGDAAATGEEAVQATLSVSPSGPVTTNTTMTGAPQAEVQRLVYNNVENSSFDPIRNENTDELSAHMFEGLFCWTEGELTLGQAESYEVSDDGLVWTCLLYTSDAADD